MKNNRSQTTEKEKLVSLGQIAEHPIRELQNPIHSVKTNLNVLHNYFEDVIELIRKFEFVLEKLNQNSNGKTAGIMQEFEYFKEKFEVESIFTDVNQAFKISFSSLEEMEKLIGSYKPVLNVELN